MADIQRMTFQQVAAGHVTLEECRTLQEYATGKVCLEIGAWFGRSTVAMAETARHVYTIDTFKGLPPTQGQSEEYTSLNGFLANARGYNNVSVMVGMSQNILPLLRDASVDMVFIDGAHDYRSVHADAVNCLRVLAPGGRMFFHDYNPPGIYPGVQQTVSELFREIEGSLNMMAWTLKEMARET